jgi:hypothetical protein
MTEAVKCLLMNGNAVSLPVGEQDGIIYFRKPKLCRRRKPKSRRSVKPQPTIKDTEESTSNSRRSTLECHSEHSQRKHTKKQGEDDNAK